MKKVTTIISSVVAALFVAVVLLLCLERVSVGYVGVVYSVRGVEQNTLSQGWVTVNGADTVVTKVD